MYNYYIEELRLSGTLIRVKKVIVANLPVLEWSVRAKGEENTVLQESGSSSKLYNEIGRVDYFTNTIKVTVRRIFLNSWNFC